MDGCAPTVPASSSLITRRSLLRSVAGLAGFGLLAATGCSSSADIPTPRATPATDSWPANDQFVSASWLREHINDPRLRLIDCSDIDRYKSGHLPGARHVWWEDTIEINNPVYGMLTGAPGREQIVRDAGITDDSLVVCYDTSGGVYAARIIWMLHGMGFTGCRLLDGGTGAWKAAGGAITDDTFDTPPGGITSAPTEEVNAHAHDIASWIGRPDLVILDTRTASERDETWFDRLRAGIIPTSRWLPRDQWLTEGAAPALLPPDELRARLTTAGAPPDTPEIIVYGLHGTLAALPWVALRAFGTPKVRLYAGSWAEWGADPTLPIDSIS